MGKSVIINRPFQSAGPVGAVRDTDKLGWTPEQTERNIAAGVVIELVIQKKRKPKETPTEPVVEDVVVVEADPTDDEEPTED